jgi:uncharacterized protein (DUF2236 family)
MTPESDARGLFGPDSITWTVDREMVLFLGGPRALLLQIAHPAVAAAVAEHSRFQSDPLGRLQRTLDSVFAIAFGTRAEAQRAVDRVTRRHATVRGVIDEASASPWSGRAYDATDPELLFWVHATLVDTALRVFELVVRPLTRAESERYCAESMRVIELLGVPRAMLPTSLDAFRAYVRDMLEGPTLAVGPAARKQAEALSSFMPSDSLVPIYGEAWGRRWAKRIDRPSVKRVFAGAAQVLGAGMLPPRLRHAFGFSWTRRDRAAYRAIVSSVRLGYRAMPESLRWLPGYRAAFERASAHFHS